MKSIVTKLIYVNAGVFLLIRLVGVGLQLFNAGGDATVLRWLQLPSDPEEWLYRPWTALTYAMVHYDLWHIIFNMLWLYWFGKLFLMFFNERKLWELYVLGGIAGGGLFMAACNVFPYFRSVMGGSYLMGASASVMAIVFAVSFHRKDYAIDLLFLGRVKLVYLALGVFLLDFLSITSSNAGGHVAHIGGALIGIGFALWEKNRLQIQVSSPRHRRPETDHDYNARKRREEQELDTILDKVKRSGYASLSSAEKKRLFDNSKR
ncbi:MAG: rhomboid family intramembrane serine protease [Tannerellaceae bacterium]|jgi:membrane associated rhomboid family serine protease|nr:rhomboid family intramembrane serine protease [Tannerellaceae bacterium]